MKNPFIKRRSGNPLRNILQKRGSGSPSSATIAKAVAANTRTLIDELRSVDFIHSSLPESILTDRKSSPDHPEICSLEWDIRFLIQLLQKNPVRTELDIRPIDEKLMILAKIFNQSVAHGDVTTAETARDALTIGVREIRCKLPNCQPEMAGCFIQLNADYLGHWITLSTYALEHDRISRNLEIEKSALQNTIDKENQLLDTFQHRIDEEPDFAEAFYKIQNNHIPTDFSKQSPIQLEVGNFLFISRENQDRRKKHTQQCIDMEKELGLVHKRMLSIRLYLSHLPTVSDPGLLNLYQKAMDWYAEKPSSAFPDFYSLPTPIQEEISQSIRHILEQHQHELEEQRSAAAEAAQDIMNHILQKEQCDTAMQEQPSAGRKPIEEMSVGELAKELFGEEWIQRTLNHSASTDS